jgi:hypothetical protein
MGDPAFEAYVTQVLAQAVGPCDIAVMDNLPSDKRAGVGSAIDAAGAELPYLALYSADLNPSDMAFAKPKARPSKDRRHMNQGFGRRYRPRSDRLHRPRVSELLRRSRL